MKRRFWTDHELATLRAAYPDTPTAELAAQLKRQLRSVYQKAREIGLRKSAAYLAGPHASRLRRGDNVGAAFRFNKGNAPWNKGTHFTAGGRSIETRFKPGQVSRRWDPELYQVGTLRMNWDGYVDIKVHDGARAWRAFHVWLWEQENGPMSRGHALVFRDGDRLNIELSNLECLSRADLMRRNTIHNLPAPIKSAVQLLGQLKRRIREKHRGPAGTPVLGSGRAARQGKPA